MKKIREMAGGHGSDADFVRTLMKRYAIGWVAVTRGHMGSVLYVNGKEFEIRIPRTEAIVDTVGTGDAYAAMLTIGYLSKWHPARIISTASNFAEKICMIEGAIPSSRDFYEEFIKQIRENNHGK